MQQFRGCLIGCGLFLLLFAIGAIGAGIQIYRVESASKSEPQTIACQTLIDKGFGDNARILLTDFELRTGGAVVEEKGFSKVWVKAWIPIVPAGVPAELDAFRLVLQTERVSGQESLRKLAQEPKIQGQIVNLISSLGSEEAKLLKESFPNADLEKVWIMKHEELGHSGMPPEAGFVCIGIGVFLLLLCIGAIALAILRGGQEETPAAM